MDKNEKPGRIAFKFPVIYAFIQQARLKLAIIILKIPCLGDKSSPLIFKNQEESTFLMIIFHN